MLNKYTTVCDIKVDIPVIASDEHEAKRFTGEVLKELVKRMRAEGLMATGCQGEVETEAWL